MTNGDLIVARIIVGLLKIGGALTFVYAATKVARWAWFGG